jgi:hypothetical protein
MAFVYVFRDRPLTIKSAKKADPQEIGAALEKIKAETKDRFNSKAIVAAARSPSHVLHKHFEWDNAVAGERYRQEQARELVRVIDIVNDGDDGRKVPAFISVTEKSGTSYKTAAEVFDSVDLQVIVLRQAERDMLAYEKRLQQFADICIAVRTARGLIADRAAKLGDRHATA